MDKHRNKRSILENFKNIAPGYSIEIGNTTFQNTLEERIQAARAASIVTKQAKKQNDSKEKFFMTNNRNGTVQNTNFQSMAIKNTINNSPNVQKRINLSKPKITNTNTQAINNTSCPLKPTCKGGPMQRRLEAIKAKKFTNTCNTYSFKCDNALESTKYSNNFTNQLDVLVENHFPNELDRYDQQVVYKCNEYNRTSSPKSFHPSDEIRPNKLIGHCDRTKNIPNTSSYKASSVQNRLIKAKEDLLAKSKFNDRHNDVYKTEEVKKELSCAYYNLHPDKKFPVLNNKNKTKRLNQKKTPTGQIVPISKRNYSEMVASEKLDDLKQRELLNSFSFVLPKQNFENVTKPQFSDDDSMEWEAIIEPINIVNEVNDLRRQNYDYEPMEWTPESIMHSDNIKHCLVIDTNIFITNLKSISILIDKFFPNYGFLTIVLPWQVLQELDCLKNSDNFIGYRAREATRWLLNTLSTNHPRLKGQPMTKTNLRGPDDAILNCAIIVKERVNVVNLVTDDKILSVKSEVNGIQVKNSAWLQNVIRIRSCIESNIVRHTRYTGKFH